MKSYTLILIFILFIAAFFRLYMLGDFFSFIGDQGWFYLSAKDLLHGEFPLVGITSSYTWVHQGALWTYILAPILLIFNYAPIGGAYLSVILSILAVYMIFLVGETLFKSKSIGLVAAALLAVSPLDIYFTRMPYHTSPIPLATLIFIFAIYKYATGKKVYLILATFMLGVLYNLALITMIFWLLTVIVLIKVRKFDPKLYLASLFSFLIPMLPMILYDLKMNSGFYQTTTFPRLVKVSIFNSSGFNPAVYVEVIKDLIGYNQRLIFGLNRILAFGLVFVSSIFLILDYFKSKSKKIDYGVFILGLWIVLCFLVILSSKHASEAYLPMFYPGIILLVSYFLVKVIMLNKKLKPLIYIILIFILFSNIYMIYRSNFLSNDSNFVSMKERMNVAKEIISVSNGKGYNLVSKGPGSEFEYNLLNYKYLGWWLGNEPLGDDQALKFTIEENNGQVYLEY